MTTTISATEQRIATLRREADTAEQALVRQRVIAAKPMARAKRQGRLNVATICNAGWLNTHTARFIQLARKAMPDANFSLLYVGESDALKASKTPDRFDRVLEATIADKDAPGYLAYNAPRYGLCSLMDCETVVYLDPDIDVLADISALPDECDTALGWCRSPVEPAGFAEAMRACGVPDGGIWSNSGTLLLRGDYSEQYAAASQMAIKSGIDPRMVGNAAFSVMLRAGMVDHAEIPYKYGSIWWDQTNYSRALCLHYCNDKGKARRDALASVWAG